MKKEKIVISHHSLLRKFNILFSASSIIPFLILFYLYLQIGETKKVEISQEQFFKLLTGVGLASFFCFLEMRRLIVKIIAFTQKLKSSFWKEIDKKTIVELTKDSGEIGELAKAFGEILGRLEENIKALNETRNTLYRVLSKIGKAVTSVEDFDALTQLTLETTVEALGAERGFIFSLEDKVLKVRACKGVEKERVTDVSLGEGVVGWVVKERKPLFIPLLEDTKVKEGDLFSPPLISCPLIFKDKVWGVICLSGRRDKKNFSEDDLKILSNLAYQIAISFENVKLSKDIEKTYFETMAALALAVEARDAYSRGHSERVMKYAVKIAERLGLSSEEKQILRDAARLHDIGKIGMADSILKKQGPLTPEEREIVCKHPIIGETIVRPLKTFSPLLKPIRHHHEFLDGTGYPDGLKGEEIDLVTRILTVADIFDALTSTRPYREPMDVERAKRELKALVDNNKLDRRVVNTLFDLIEKGELYEAHSSGSGGE